MAGNVIVRLGKLDKIQRQPFQPYSQEACDFLSMLSNSLLSDNETRAFPDVVSFAYWCRKSNITRLREKAKSINLRVGRGIAFHITPSNVDINAAFSFAFSLLAGNSNIVRLPSKDSTQVNILCKHIEKIISGFEKLQNNNAFVQYERNDENSAEFSRNCDVRIIWGGDRTISEIRRIPLPPRAIELTFADRYSLCVINSDALTDLDDKSFSSLINNFYNDAYLMDQNACSSPHLVAWLGRSEFNISRFWNELWQTVKVKYDLQAVNAIDKYTDACLLSLRHKEISRLHRYDNFLYVYGFDSIPMDLENFRGRFGSYFEVNISNLDEIAKVINPKFQTLTYLGIEKQELVDFVTRNNITGLDRIVPIGSALEMSVIWDGYDMIEALSRIIDIK